MKNSIILLFLVFLLNSCGFGEWEISELYALKIEGTSKILYRYDAWGGRDSHAFGYRVLDSTEAFKVEISDDLPFYYLQDIPSKNTIQGVSHLCDNSCGENYYKTKPIFIPIDTKNSRSNGIKIENKIYQYRGFAERDVGLERFHFEKFKEARDSIFFYNLDDVESIDGVHLDSLKLKKKTVLIQEDKDSEVVKIVLEDLVLNKETDEILSNKTYFLTPRNKTKSDSFSNYGIFKEIKK